MLLEALAVDQVAARSRPQRDPGDRRLALSGGPVAGTRGEVDRGGRDRLGDRLLLLVVLAGAGLLCVLLDRVGVDVLIYPPQRVDALGDDVDLEVGTGHRRLLARGRLLVGLGRLCLGGLLGGLESGVLGRARDLLGLGAGDGVTLAGGLDGDGLRRGLPGRRVRRLQGGLEGRVLGGACDRGRLLAGDGVLGRLGAVGRLGCLLVCHQTSISMLWGCCATCGCSGPA